MATMRFICLSLLALVCAAAQPEPVSAQTLAWSWSNPLPHGNDVVGMAWNGTLGVQVCDGGQIYTSPDLVNWTPQNSNLTNNLQAVTFFGNRLIVTGANGALAYSDDGVNFTASSLGITNWLVGVAASSNLVLAVGDSGLVYTSTNGSSWQKQASPPSLDGYWLNSVTFGNGIFMVAGDGGYLASTTNGVNWVNLSSEVVSEYLGNLETVVWINSSGSSRTFPYTGFWTVTDNNTYTGNSYAYYSTNNGAGWSPVKFSVQPTNTLYTIAADTATALVAGDSEVRLGSPVNQQVAWSEQIGTDTTNAPAWTYFASVLQTNGVYELAGYDGMLVEGFQTNGGYNWVTPYDSARDWLWQVTLANGLYVAVGDNARIMTSSDGMDWTVEDIEATNSVSSTDSLTNTVFLGVGGNTNLLLAVGNSGSLALSPNLLTPVTETNADGDLFTNLTSSIGIIWYPQPAPAGITNDLTAVCAGTDGYFLAGAGGILLSSPDGTNWSKEVSGTTNDLLGLTVFTNGLLVATGNNGTLLTSPDGTNWSKQVSGTTNGLYRVHSFNGRLLVVGGNGTLLTSLNATNWVTLTSGVTNWLNDAILISNTCYVVGNQGVVLACTNFSANVAHWTRVGTITTKSLESAATQNGQLVVAGMGGTILRSQVIPVTNPVNFTQYSQAGGYNVYSVQGVLDQQFTLDSSTDLLNWVTGPVLDINYGDGSLTFYQSQSTNNPPPAQFYRCTVVP